MHAHTRMLAGVFTVVIGGALAAFAALGAQRTTGTTPPATGAAQRPAASADSGTEYKAPDGSLTLRVPRGWSASTNLTNGTPVHVLQPGDGGEDRILVASGIQPATSIQDLAQQSAVVVTQQLIPGTRVTAMPKYLQVGDRPAAEISYELMGQSVWWHCVVMLKDNGYLTVLGGARRDRAAAMEQQSRAVLASVKLTPPAPGAASAANAQLSKVLIGPWTWYHKTSNAGGGIAGSTSRELWFYPNGRYQYTAVTYVPNMPTGVDPTTTVTGTYQVQGNKIVARADNGQSQTFTFEVVDGGKGIKIDGELYIREG